MKQKKKMTEAEIMKEIETLLQIARFVDSDYVTSSFETKVLIAIQDLINRKNAENAEKDAMIDALVAGQETLQKLLAKSKVEAVKEFLDKVETVMFYDETEYVNVLCLKRLAEEMGVEL